MKKIRKRTISTLIIILICTAAAIFVQGSVFMDNNDVVAETSPNADIRFAVLGDVHGNAEKLHINIRELNKIRPDLDALVLNGDTVDEGLKNEYDAIKKTLRKNYSYLPETIIKNIGNHEFFDYKKEYNTAEDVAEFINRYLEFAGEKTVYHDKWVNGYHFISLGSENGNTKDFNSVKAYISDKQLRWFKEKIAERHEKGRPVFVFLHQHLSTSMRGWVGTDQSEDIKKILSDYPEAVLFTSHTHVSPEADNVKVDQPFTMVHTGAVHYTLVPDGKGGRTRTDDNFGVYIEVHDNKVTIKGWSFTKKAWIYTKEVLN